ncbi:NnrS family protein [Rugamonas sp.]|uniref:NnrS family protein n=1 Tax=Rugamonas sp. TaxID=1926287 RepID=UPI0025EF3116|nr:NnrS family protein [Rugamonas sp.]
MNQLASLMPIDEPQPIGASRVSFIERSAFFGLGFRPFYLLAAVFAVLSVPVWLLAFLGHLGSLPNVTLLWHMHEMVLGFAVAVVVGFLFTAARNWTGLWTPRGRTLALIAAVWLAGRAAMLLAPPAIAAGVDLLFLPVAIVPLLNVMLRSGKRSNLPLLALLVLLFLTNLSFHASVLGWSTLSPMKAIEVAILVLAVLSTVMGGRVIPGFTKNMAPGSAPRSDARVDRAGVGLLIAASLAWTLDWPGALSATLALAAGLLQWLRLAYWTPAQTRAYPLLWILHLAFAWIGLGFLLLGAAQLGYASVSTAMHAIAIGGMSSLILGMMSRTTLGHTGHRMRAERHEWLIFGAVQCAAIFRILANVLDRDARGIFLTISAIFWVIAFATFIAMFGALLCRPRMDGREG